RRSRGRTLYVLDEPTTGLHTHDIRNLLDVLNRLVDQGNTVIVIEHNLDVIKTADYIIDLGPEGGDRGGRVVAQGTPEEVALNPNSYTGQFLRPILEKAGTLPPARKGHAKALSASEAPAAQVAEGSRAVVPYRYEPRDGRPGAGRRRGTGPAGGEAGPPSEPAGRLPDEERRRRGDLRRQGGLPARARPLLLPALPARAGAGERQSGGDGGPNRRLRVHRHRHGS